LLKAKEILDDFSEVKVTKQMSNAEINQFHHKTLECLELISGSFRNEAEL
jgi:hypothetical protein